MLREPIPNTCGGSRGPFIETAKFGANLSCKSLRVDAVLLLGRSPLSLSQLSPYLCGTFYNEKLGMMQFVEMQISPNEALLIIMSDANGMHYDTLLYLYWIPNSSKSSQEQVNC